MLVSKGNLLTPTKSIEIRALKVYKERHSGNRIKDHLKDLENDTNEICNQGMSLFKFRKTNK